MSLPVPYFLIYSVTMTEVCKMAKNRYIIFREGFINTNKMTVSICGPSCKLASCEAEVTTGKQGHVQHWLLWQRLLNLQAQ